MPTQSWEDMLREDQEGRTPAPAGKYVMQVTKATLGVKKGTEIPQWLLVCEIAEGKQKGKAVFLRLTFDGSNASRRMAMDAIRRMGIDPAAQNLIVKEAERVFVGRKFEAELVTREYNGSLNNDIKQITKPLTSGVPSGVGAPPPKDEPAKPVSPLARTKAI